MAGAVSSQMLQTSSQLVSLVVNDSAIVSLPDSLSALVCLTELDVTNSRLTSIPQAVWFLPKIKILKADRNKINSLEAVSASAHPHLAPLEVLDLSYNIRLKELPGIITHLVTLTRLDVSFNQLTGLPGEAHLRDTRVLSQTLGTNSSTWGLDAPRFKLQELQCGCNRLEHVPAVVRTFTQLRSLGLARTRLKHVPDWLWSLSTLQQLDLRFNSIKQLPEIPEGTMTQLARLNVSANLLSELPASIGRLCNLTDLEAELNYIQVLPNSFSQLSKLQTLMLSWNHFNSVPPCVGHLKSLETLYICDQHPPKSDGADRWLLASTEVHVPSQLLQLPNLGELGLDFHDRQPVRPPVLQELYLQGVSIQNETDMGNRESAWESQLQQLQDDGLNW
eukprot:jgi/Chrzof1/6288/Cz18g00090.t1